MDPGLAVPDRRAVLRAAPQSRPVAREDGLALLQAAGNAAVARLLRAPEAGRTLGRPAAMALQRLAGNAATSRLVGDPEQVLQRKWIAQVGAHGIYYHHHIGGVRDPAARRYKHVSGAAYVDDQDDIWSERRNEQLYRRNDVIADFAGTRYGTRAVGQSRESFNFSMRLAKVPPGGRLISSSQKTLDLLHKRYGQPGTKVRKSKFHKYKLASKVGLIRGRTFMYLPGVTKTRKPKKQVKAKATKQQKQQLAKLLKKAPLPLGAASASPKRQTLTLRAPAAKGGRSSTAGAFNGVGAGLHASVQNALLPAHVQPAASRRWEWLHLIGDAIGGLTVSANLAAGTFDSNSRHNAIEEAVVRESQTATAADPVTYEVEAPLLPGTEIATEFRCRAKRPSHNGGAWVSWPPVDTLSITKEDRVEDALRRHSEHRTLTK